MAVPPEVSKAIFGAELDGARPLAEDQGWILEVLGDLSLRAAILAPARNGGQQECFIFEFSFDDYREKPPLIDLVHPTTGARNTPECFPKGTCLSYFHDFKRICAPWSRRAYAEFQGPHPEWPYGDWVKEAGPIKELGLYLHELRSALHDASYEGRHQP